MSHSPLRVAASLATIALLTVPAAASAQVFTGYTEGCFGTTTSTTCTPSSSSAGLGGLSFAGVGTAGSPAAFGTAVGGNLALTNLGTFTIARVGRASYSGSFTLGLSFVLPGGSDTFFATVIGQLNPGGNAGDVVANFGGAQTLTYAGGTFDVTINDVDFSPSAQDRTETLTGRISNVQAVVTTAPEPATVVLMGSGLLGLMGVAARRRSGK